ncbi:MAG: hypothetical protein KAX09_00090 [Candidatus Heimdallarchaeota archaeon]|nr:hypothetical protein [Candidatus Heimdallarchaeota archaeon]MCK4289354.1 hypothetical protein [Candidatus Heimdallarchaeota archaeon]
MIENAIIFTKEANQVLITSTFGEVDPGMDDFSNSLAKIQEIAIKLEKGVFNLDLAAGLTAIIFAIQNISVALVFSESIDKRAIKEWEDVAKQIATGIDKIYDPMSSDNDCSECKKVLDEIVEWHLKEESPIDKMKDALW